MVISTLERQPKRLYVTLPSVRKPQTMRSLLMSCVALRMMFDLHKKHHFTRFMESLEGKKLIKHQHKQRLQQIMNNPYRGGQYERLDNK